MLTGASAAEACTIAAQLEQQNRQRQAVERQIVDQAKGPGGGAWAWIARDAGASCWAIRDGIRA